MSQRRSHPYVRKDAYSYGFVTIDKPWVVATHASLLLVLAQPAFGAVIVPLWLFILRGDESDGVEAQTRDAFNFGVTVSLLAVFMELLGEVLVLLGLQMEYAGAGQFAVIVLTCAFGIRAVMITSKGRAHHYPLSIQFMDDPHRGTSQ